MAATVPIRFLTGRAHLHHWKAHHSDGKIDWPPSPWRLLRALVAVAGRGLTTLPPWDDIPPTKQAALVRVPGLASLQKRGVPKPAQTKLSFLKARSDLRLNEPLSDAEAEAWIHANPSKGFAVALEKLRRIASLPVPTTMADVVSDEIPLSRLAFLVCSLLPLPEIWVPRTSHGHTRQYFPIHESGRVEPSGVPVFDTFAVLSKATPILFHWPSVSLSPANESDRREQDLIRILGRMTYFGRAESWCEASYSAKIPSCVIAGETHWCCLPNRLSDESPTNAAAVGREGVDYILERKLCPPKALGEELRNEFVRFLPALVTNKARRQALCSALQGDSGENLLLRCLLRESGDDIAAHLDRPIGTRWVHYTVPRAVYDVPSLRSKPQPRRTQMAQLVRYDLNTATTHRPVLPPLTDTLLVADKFRAASIAIHENVVDRNGQCHPRNLCGHEENGNPRQGHEHAFFWPTDEDSDGFIDHVTVYCPDGFGLSEIDALRRLVRIRQRGGRPDLLVTPVFVGKESEFAPWQPGPNGEAPRVFVSATPYFCPVHLGHGKSSGGRPRSIAAQIRKGLREQNLIVSDDDVCIDELVFDYAPEEFAAVRSEVDAGRCREPVPPRQYFPVMDAPKAFPPLPRLNGTVDSRFSAALVKDPDVGYPFGVAVGLCVDKGTRFIRAMAFCRRRRSAEAKGSGRMFRLTFRGPRGSRRPFAIGSQCHFGLGLFIPERQGS